MSPYLDALNKYAFYKDFYILHVVNCSKMSQYHVRNIFYKCDFITRRYTIRSKRSYNLILTG